MFPIASLAKRLVYGFLLLLAACGEDFFASQMADAICDRYAECCSDFEFDDQTGTSDVAQCREAYSSGYRRSFIPALERSIEAGRVAFHPDAMLRCMSELQSRSCVEAMSFLQGGGLWMKCPDAFEGRVAIGGACGTPWDCTSVHCSGLSLDITGNLVGLGVCAEVPTVGMECGDYRCVAGAYCDDALICQAVRPAGSSCARDWQCASGACNDLYGICADQTRCDGME